MMKYLYFLLVLTTAFFLNSCATILTGTTQRLTIDSSPQGAEIIIDGRIMGTTPAKVRLERDLNSFIDDGKFIELNLDGYYPDGYILGADIEPTVVFNVFMPFGFAFDAVTGAIMRYDSDYYNFRLIPYEDTQNTGLKSQENPVGNSTTTKQDSSSEDDYEKLMKLVELYEDGLITEEEFEAEKAKIFENKRH